jgi:catechol 2,3-dioxygenase-like lactoylglutathione lyase family enzyme
VRGSRLTAPLNRTKLWPRQGGANMDGAEFVAQVKREDERLLPKLDALLESSLYVDDLARSVRFYQSVLGLELIASDAERLRAMGVAGRHVLLLFKKGASADHDGDGRLHVAFAIPVAELAAWEKRLAECGVAIETRTTWPRGGQSLYFRDPDGHLLELATPGVWSLY